MYVPSYLQNLLFICNPSEDVVEKGQLLWVSPAQGLKGFNCLHRCWSQQGTVALCYFLRKGGKKVKDFAKTNTLSIFLEHLCEFLQAVCPDPGIWKAGLYFQSMLDTKPSFCIPCRAAQGGCSPQPGRHAGAACTLPLARGEGAQGWDLLGSGGLVYCIVTLKSAWH